MRARGAIADIASLKGETVKKVLTRNEHNFQDNLGNKMEDIAAKKTATDADLATTLGVFGNFVGPLKEQTGMVIQRCMVLHSFLHLDWKDRKTELDIFDTLSLTVSQPYSKNKIVT